MYILLSDTLAVVISAVRGTMISPAVVAVDEVRCSLYPKIHPFVWLYPHLASVSMPERGTTPFFMDDLCHTPPFAFKRVLSIAVIERSTIPSVTNRCPIVDILCLISVEIDFNRLSNVRLLGIDTRPQASTSLRLYRQSMLRKVCNALLESILNHTRTIKHLTITVGEYIYGLPRFRGKLGHGIQPVRYRMLKSMDSFSLSRANLSNSLNQNHIPEVSFKLLYNVSKDNLNYDQVSCI